MDSKQLRWVSVGACFALFAAVDLLVLFLTPGPDRGVALVPPTIAALVVVATLPFLTAYFERQQSRIERQRREIDTLHAMDTAIVAEMELSSLLDVAVRQATEALDAEQGGIVLLDGDGQVAEEAFFEVVGELRPAFRALVERGINANDRWEVARAPLARGSETLGYLAAAKRRPCSVFTPGDHAVLAALAGTVVVAVTNARALEAARDGERKARELAQVQAELSRERRVARALLEGLLPNVPNAIEPWVFSHRYEPQSAEAQVGGDIYDLFALGPGRWGLVIADVSGKGLAAAQKTAMVKYALRSYAREHAAPAAVLERLNDALFDEPDMNGFVTLIYGVLGDDGRFRYASAGHETPIIRRAGGPCETLAPTGLVLGAVRDQEYGEVAVTLHPGDGLLLYTDGLSEARSPQGKFLEVEGLMALLAARSECPAGAIADLLLDDVLAYTGGTLSDDTAILWVERAAEHAADPANKAVVGAPHSAAPEAR